jgi:DNA (cytosine-5)-methyltransferase 1
MKLLDLYCGAGGASMGYHQAGFEILGIDIEPQPSYPFPFIQADSLDPPVKLTGFDLIHASPPCKAYTKARLIHGGEYPDMISATRAMLDNSGVPWVMENVMTAPLRRDLMLCGSMFGLQGHHGYLQRHRLFELSWPGRLFPPRCRHNRPTVTVTGHGGHVYHDVHEWRRVMDIDWMDAVEMTQAVPPAYTKFVGEGYLDR